MSYCMPPECDGIPNPSRHAIEPDWVASECDDQLPAFSKIGRGPRGKGVYAEIEKTGDGQIIIHFKDDETGEEIGNTGDIAAGRISVSYAPENPVAGDEVKMFVSVRSGSSVANYVVPVPSGAHGSRIYLFPGPVMRNSDDTYQCSVDDLTIYGLQRWESKPDPRPNDVILFNYEDSDGHGFAFGTIEAVERGQVVYTARVFNTLPGVSILPDGTWGVDGESTGIKAQGPKGEDAKIKVRREGDKAVITATDSDGETTAEVLDGNDGRDAKLSVQRVENGAMLTATDSDGITTAIVRDGADGEDGEDGISPTLTLGSVQETVQPQVTIVPGRVQLNEYVISFGLPRGADGKSVDIQGGIYQVDQLPDFDETPVNRAFIVNDGDNVYDLYIRGRVPVIAEEGGPWTVVEDWQGMQGYSLRLLNGYKISQDAPISIPKEEADTAFTPSINVQDGDLVLDANSMIGIVGSAQDDSGTYTVSYVAKLQVKWDNVSEKPEDLLQTSDIIQGDNIKVEADAQAGTVKISADIQDGAITGDMLASNSIDTSKIIDGAVTEDKIAEGVIPSEYVLPVATEDILGGVKSDGETVSIADDGKLSVIKKPLAKQVCGNVISVNDASAQKPLGLKVYGNTRQNLWVNPSGANVGVTVTPNADGSFTLSGTSTAVNYTVAKSVEVFTLKPSTTYTLSVSPTPPCNFAVQFDNGSITGFSVHPDSNKTTFTSPDTFTYVRMIVFLSLANTEVGQTFSGTYRVMLNEGSEAEPWCPPGLNSVSEVSIVFNDESVSENIITTPIELFGNKLCSIGEHVDALDVINGSITAVCGRIASYNGEEIGDTWIASDLDESGVPTTGSEVVYLLNELKTITLLKPNIPALPAPNFISHIESNIPCEMCLSYMTEDGGALSDLIMKDNIVEVVDAFDDYCESCSSLINDLIKEHPEIVGTDEFNSFIQEIEAARASAGAFKTNDGQDITGIIFKNPSGSFTNIVGGNLNLYIYDNYEDPFYEHGVSIFSVSEIPTNDPSFSDIFNDNITTFVRCFVLWKQDESGEIHQHLHIENKITGEDFYLDGLFDQFRGGFVPATYDSPEGSFLCNDGTWKIPGSSIPVATETTLGGIKVSSYDTASGFMGF